MPNRLVATKPPMMSAETLLGSVEAAAELGLDLTDALSQSGISLEQITTGEGDLPLPKVVSFLNEAARQSKCEHFGLLIAKHQPPARFAMIGQLIRFSATLGDAIDDAIRFSLLNSEYSAWDLDPGANTVALVRHARVAIDAPVAQLQTLAVALVYKAMGAICRRRIVLAQVGFSHAPPLEPARVEKFFGAPVIYNQGFTGLVLPRAELAVPIPSADQAVRKLLVAHLQNLARASVRDFGIVERLRHEIRQSVGSRRCTLAGICQHWGMHPRGLQRSLGAHGTHFRELLREVRQELAEEYLRDSSISVTELSDILGYRNASAFSRAFKQAVGVSPDHWRAATRPDAPQSPTDMRLVAK